MKRILILSCMNIFFLCSCKKNDTPGYNANVKAPLSVEFDNIAGSGDLQLNTGTYVNASGETFSVSKLKYYVSNFSFTTTDGSIYTVPQDSCYFLIDESDEETHEPIMYIPEGEYRTVSFLIGIDSLKSRADLNQRTGVLDPGTTAADMYWDQNSGYIFFNVEGNSTSSSSGNFSYHVGGYGNSPSGINNLRIITLDLTVRGTPKVKAGKETNIHLMVDILKLFSGSTNISIAADPVVMFDPFSVSIADNYANMIRHDHTEN